MSNGIWINEHTFVDFSETASRRGLGEEIASRQTAWDYSGMLGLLPDPDPILAKRGDSAEILDGLTSDAHLCSVIQTRKLGTLKREIKWEAGAEGDAEPTPEAQALRDNLVADLVEIDTYTLVSQILDAPLYGFVPFELSWKAKDGHIRLTNITAKPHRWFGFDEVTNAPKFISMANPWDGEELPYGKFVLARHFPTYDNPYGLRLLSRCLWPVTFKRGGLKFWVTFTEKFGIPFLMGRYPKGTGAADQQAMLDKLAAMVQSAVAVLPEGSSVELLGAGGNSKGSSDLFDRLVSVMDKEMSKVIMGQTLTAETSDKGGAYAQSKTHADVLADYQDSDQRLVKNVFERIAKLYAAVNASGVAAPTMDWFEEEDAKKEFAERDKTLSDTGVKFTKNYYQRQYDLQEDDFELDNSTTAAGQGDNPTKTGANAPQEFAEPEDTSDLAELLTAKMAVEADPEIALMVQTVRELVMSADSLEDIRDGLLGLYPEMHTEKLSQLMELALSGADLAGRMTVRDDLMQRAHGRAGAAEVESGD